MPTTLLNLALYELGWFACALGAAHGWPHAGAVIAAALTISHVILARDRKAELGMVGSAMVIGLLGDSVLASLGRINYHQHLLLGWMPPWWILVLWLQFGTLFHFSLAWLRGRYALGSLLGALGGPIAFLAGARLGALSFPPPAIRGLLAIALEWSLAMPLLLLVAERLGSWSRGYRVFAKP